MYSFITTSGPALDPKDRFVVRSHNMRLCRRARKSSCTPRSTIVNAGLISLLTVSPDKNVSETADSYTSDCSQPTEEAPTVPVSLPIELDQPGPVETRTSSPWQDNCSRYLHKLQSPARKRCVLTAKDVAHDLAVIRHIEACILCFNSPVAERAVGMTMWVEAMLPPSAWSCPIPASALGAWALPRCKSHEYGNDAIALLNIGCSEGDDRLALAGRRLHMATIQALRKDLACLLPNIQGIFAASLDLLLASCYMAVSPGVTVWLSHLAGQTDVLKSRLAEMKALGFCTFVFAHYRQLNLIRSLVHRQRMPLTHSDWKIGGAAPSSGHSETLYRLAVRIPAFLELTDRLLASTNDNTSETTRVIVALLQLERSLLEWFKAWIALQPSREPLGLNLNNLDTTNTVHDNLCFEDGLLAGLLWCLLLLIHESIYDLAGSQQSEIYSVTQQMSFRKAKTYALLLHGSVHRLCRQAGAPLSQALAVSAPLHFARRWFSRIFDIERFEGCVRLQKSLRAKAPYLDWDIILFWSFVCVNWLVED
jgi:hypothetical protein